MNGFDIDKNEIYFHNFSIRMAAFDLSMMAFVKY